MPPFPSLPSLPGGATTTTTSSIAQIPGLDGEFSPLNVANSSSSQPPNGEPTAGGASSNSTVEQTSSFLGLGVLNSTNESVIPFLNDNDKPVTKPPSFYRDTMEIDSTVSAQVKDIFKHSDYASDDDMDVDDSVAGGENKKSSAEGETDSKTVGGTNSLVVSSFSQEEEAEVDDQV